MSNLPQYHVLLTRTDEQPSDDHVAYASGKIDKDFQLEVPFECLYLPLATYMAIGAPETITVSISVGDNLPGEQGLF